jgi:SAM-dependent methyltransferase
MDIQELYELCVQSPAHVVPMLRAIHGGEPRVLGEDFAGTAAVSRAWCATDPGARAIAVDLDAALLARAGDGSRIERIAGDVRTATHPQSHRADVIFVGNFSIGYLRTRAELLAYLRRAAERLSPGGVFICDTYGGESAFRAWRPASVRPATFGTPGSSGRPTP